MKKTALIILDGFGINNISKEENAIFLAKTPNFDKLFESEKFAKLEASGKAVGIPEGNMGNSEVGHFTIGTGQIVKQSIVEINDLFEEKKFQNLESFKKLINNSLSTEGFSPLQSRDNSGIISTDMHIATMLGFTGVHAHQQHLYEFIKIIPKNIKINLHLFSDGRDSGVKESLSFVEDLEKFIQNYKNVEISSISGRFFAMDRDSNFERNEKTFEVIFGIGKKTNLSVCEYLKESYKKEIFDEFIEPVNFDGANFLPLSPDKEREFKREVFVLLNFRPDRAKQLIKVVSKKIDKENIFTMTKYYDEFKGNVFLKKKNIENTLGKVLENNGLTQLHLAETEKFAHVTKFFNGGKSGKYIGETQILINSKKVESYKEIPEMSALEIFETFKKEASKYDFSVVNFANGDMVGHTGNMEATIKSIEFLDKIVGKLIDFSDENNIELLITADHGNCEVMGIAKNPCTTHTTNLVPFWYISNKKFINIKKTGGLSNIAGTVLKIMGIEKVGEMGESLL